MPNHDEAQGAGTTPEVQAVRENLTELLRMVARRVVQRLAERGAASNTSPGLAVQPSPGSDRRTGPAFGTRVRRQKRRKRSKRKDPGL